MDPARLAIVVEHATRAGVGWSRRIRSALAREGRAASGGFPGTMREIRGDATLHVTRALATAGHDTLDSAERLYSARLAYSSARDEWHAHSVPDDELCGS